MSQQYNYESEYAKKRVLQVINNGENRIREIQQKQKEIDKLLRNARLDLVYARTVFFGRAKGRTGKRKNSHKDKTKITLDLFRRSRLNLENKK